MPRTSRALPALLLAGFVTACMPLPAPASPEDEAEAAAAADEPQAPKVEPVSEGEAEAEAEAEAPAFDFPAIANDDPSLARSELNKEVEVTKGVFLTVHARAEPGGGDPAAWTNTQSLSDTFSVLMPPQVTDYTLRARDAAGTDWFTHALVANTQGGGTLNVNCHQLSSGPVPEATYEEQLVSAMMEAGGEVAKLESAESRAYELVNDKGTHLRSWWTNGQICTARFDAASHEKLPPSDQIGKVFESFSMAAATK